MPEAQRDFKGVWIPKAVWLDSRLTALDKVILTEIDSLDQGEKGCFASNKHIADFCQCSERKVSESVSQLLKYGYIRVQNFDGRQRELRSCLADFARQNSKKYEADTKNLRHSNTPNNTGSNTSKKVSTKGYAEILSQIADASLKELYVEYIKMRKLINSPMTDRALTMLINKVNTLEPDSIDRQKKLLETAIINNWKSVYPLKEELVRGRKEVVPGWMKREMDDDEKQAIQRMMAEPDLADMTEQADLAQRADRLKQRLQGGL